MKLLPLDIKQQQFRKAMRGYSPADVQTFLDVVAQAFEEVIKENNSLKDDLRRHINQVNDYREKESTLKEAMLTAQKLSEDLKASAKKEADLLVQEAELKGERIVNDAHQKMIKIMDKIQELKLERARLISSFHSLLQQHLKMLEASAEEAHHEPEMNLAYLKTLKNRSEA